MEDYEIAFRIRLQRQVWGWFEDGQLGADLTAELHGGRYRCTALEVSPLSGGFPGVTGERLRELKVSEMVEIAARQPHVEERLARRGRSVFGDPDTPEEAVAAIVAAAYRYGHAIGDRPTREVMQLLELSRSQAGRWIAVCREFGLLADTREREAGGVIPADDVPRERVSSLRAQIANIESRIAKLERRASQALETPVPSGGEFRAHRGSKSIDEVMASEHRRLERLRSELRDAEQKT